MKLAQALGQSLETLEQCDFWENTADRSTHWFSPHQDPLFVALYRNAWELKADYLADPHIRASHRLGALPKGRGVTRLWVVPANYSTADQLLGVVQKNANELLTVWREEIKPGYFTRCPSRRLSRNDISAKDWNFRIMEEHEVSTWDHEAL